MNMKNCGSQIGKQEIDRNIELVLNKLKQNHSDVVPFPE
jgi:hypothetical protein